MKRVMILSRQSAFWWGVQRLLRDGGGCDLVGWETEVDQALERIRELRPDVVLVDKGDARADNASPIMRILGEGLGMCVIALGLEENTLSLYREERRTVDDVEDLIRAIEQDPAISPGGVVDYPD